MLALMLLWIFGLEVAKATPHTKSPPDPTCYPEVRIKRNTIWRVLEMSSLKINCTVLSCKKQSTVTWCKLDETNCKALTEDSNVKIWQEPVDDEINLIMSYMEIKQTTKGYSGEYSCRISEVTAGHAINVTVIHSEHFESTTENTNEFSTTDNKHSKQGFPSVVGHTINVTVINDLSTTDEHSNQGWLPYVIICVAIYVVIFVALVMLISFLRLYVYKSSVAFLIMSICFRISKGLSSHPQDKAPLLDKIPQDLVTVVMFSTADDFQSKFTPAE
ncbi:hypothetical protein ACEWY4_022906 [Coilia grayii]|uniref:Ig-like domain-containing protein n=1 Tax=Coilia grayii TaxID=363190 RepID=A0ABD1J1H6_9TELE